VNSADPRADGKPPWLKVKLPTQRNFFVVAELLKRGRLHTICQSAKCPNISECWSARTATFLILGDTCTRSCAFCAVKKGNPSPPCKDEPAQVAEAAISMELDYAVVTSVTRDDLADGGSSLFVQTVKEIKARRPQAGIEVLVPDFKGDEGALADVVRSGPDIVNHNIETAAACYPLIHRPVGNYSRSLSVLKKAKDLGALTKSGLMVGLGESAEEIRETLEDLRSVGVRLLTVGQYLRPGRDNAPVARYYTPQEFEEIKVRALGVGFEGVESGPLVRSSYQARRMFVSLQEGGVTSPCVT
jgi:lipoic acid synthetase